MKPNSTAALSLLMICITFTLTCPSFAQTADPAAIQHAAEAISSLPSLTRTPDSFVLVGVWQTGPRAKKTKAFEIGQYDICFEFRSFDKHGQYGENQMAIQYWSYKKTAKNGQIDLLGTVYDANRGWTPPCHKNNLEIDITAQVKAAISTSQPPGNKQ